MSLDFWNQRYVAAGDDFVFGIHPTAFLIAQAKWLSPGMKVLSVADGEGRNSVWLAEQGISVDAVEFAPAAVDKARKLAESRALLPDVAPRFIQADLLAWDWPVAAYDAVLAVFIQFAAPAERERLFRHMVAALKPGGLLLLHGYTPKQIEYGTGGPSAVENLYTADLLRHSFADLEILELNEYEAVIEEGQAHRGQSALIDLIARKPA